MRESEHDPCPEQHPHRCAPSHSGRPTCSHEALSKPLARNEFLTEPGFLGIVRPNEDSFKYAAKMAAWEAKTGDWRGRFKITRLTGPKLTYSMQSALRLDMPLALAVPLPHSNLLSFQLQITEFQSHRSSSPLQRPLRSMWCPILRRT